MLYEGLLQYRVGWYRSPDILEVSPCPPLKALMDLLPALWWTKQMENVNEKQLKAILEQKQMENVNVKQLEMILKQKQIAILSETQSSLSGYVEVKQMQQ